MSLFTPYFFDSDGARKLWGKLSLCFSLWSPRNLPVSRNWMQVYQGSHCGILECGTDVFEEPATLSLKRTIFFFAAHKTYDYKYSLPEKLISRTEIISSGRILKVCLRVGMKYHLMRIFLRNEKGCLTLRWLMSYIYGAPILDVSRSHTTTQHSR